MSYRCYQNFIAEEYNTHDCPIRIKRIQTTRILNDYGVIIDHNGDEVRLIKTVEGIVLRLVKCEHPIPHNLPHQPKGNRDDINLRGNITLKMVMSS